MAITNRTKVLILGFIKLVLMSIPQVVSSALALYRSTQEYIWYKDRGAPLYIVAIFAGVAVYAVLDLCFCGVLLLGGHKKSRALLRVSFWCAAAALLVCVGLTAFRTIDCVVLMVKNPVIATYILSDYRFYLTVLWYGYIHIALQIALLVLVRKEISALTSGGHTAASEYTRIAEPLGTTPQQRPLNVPPVARAPAYSPLDPALH